MEFLLIFHQIWLRTIIYWCQRLFWAIFFSHSLYEKKNQLENQKQQVKMFSFVLLHTLHSKTHYREKPITLELVIGEIGFRQTAHQPCRDQREVECFIAYNLKWFYCVYDCCHALIFQSRVDHIVSVDGENPFLYPLTITINKWSVCYDFDANSLADECSRMLHCSLFLPFHDKQKKEKDFFPIKLYFKFYASESL